MKQTRNIADRTAFRGGTGQLFAMADDQMTAFEGKIEVIHELHRIGALTREQLERLIEPPRQELHKLKFSESSQAT